MKNPGFRLTRHAAIALRDIHNHSARIWGRKKADAYSAKLYDAIKRAVLKPEAGRARGKRSTPFLMRAAGKHFIIYDRIKSGIVILALLHQSRNIEQILKNLEPEFLARLDALRKNET